MRVLRLLPALAILATLALGACASKISTAGASLARAGQTATGQMEQNVTLTSAQYRALKDAVIFSDGFAGAPNNPFSKSFLEQEAAVQANLAKYGKVLGDLAAAYAALGDLATYDASGAFSTAAGSLCGSTSAFITQVSAQTHVPSEVCQAAQGGGGFVIGVIQGRDVVDASNKIDAILQTVIPVLSDPTVEALVIMNNQLVEQQITGTAENLYASGVYSCGTLLDALGASLGLKTVANVDAVVARNKNLKAGCLNYVSVTAQDTTDAIAGAYRQSVDGLKALHKLHMQLANGAPLSLSDISAIVSNLQTLATKLQPPKGQ